MKKLAFYIVAILVSMIVFSGCTKKAPTLSYSVISNRCTQIANESKLIDMGGGDIKDKTIQCRFVVEPNLSKTDATEIVNTLFEMDYMEAMLSVIASHGDISKQTHAGGTYDLRDYYNTIVLFKDPDENVLFTYRTYRWFPFLPFWS